MDSLQEPAANCRDQSDSAGSSSRVSSVSELASLTDHYRATGRLRRESQSQAEGGIGQNTYKILNRTLTARLDNLGLFDEQNRNPVSVIQYTPARKPATSTPSNSPPPPILPRDCQSIGPPVPPRSRPHSPACSELSSISGSEVFLRETDNSYPLPLYLRAPGTPIPNPETTTTITMEAAEKSVKSKMRKLTIQMKSYRPSHLSAGTVSWHKEYIDEVRNLYKDLIESIEVLCEDFESELGAEKLGHWQGQPDSIERDFDTYISSFSEKLDQIQGQNHIPDQVPQSSLDQFQTQQLKLLQQQNDICQSRITAEANETMRENDAKKMAAKKKAKAKRAVILNEIDELSYKVSAVDDWREESDYSISRGLRNLDKWNKEMEKITSMFHEFTDIISTNDLTEDDVEVASTRLMVDKMTKDMKETNTILDSEDLRRELYTLDTSTVDKIKLPTFEGRDEEDFARFKEEMKRGFIHNKVTKVDQLLKLRESLKGHAKKLVPDSLTQDIDEAWEVLDKAFGDPIRMIRCKTDMLSRMESLPRENGKKGVKGQVEWYIELESLMQSLLVHGRSSTKLGMIIFQPLFINNVYNLFPTSLANKLIKCDGEADEHFENVLGKISRLRADTQKLQLAREVKQPSTDNKKDDPSSGTGGGRRQGYLGYGGGRGGKQGGKGHSICTIDPPSLVTHNPPVRDENCRICNTLNAQGDTSQLYDNHFSNYPTGCPRYIGMSVNKRYQIALQAKLCIACHHPDYIFRKNDKDHKCSVVSSKRKGRFTCQTSSCFVHLWVCTRHKDSNKGHLEKFQEEMKSKYNMDFGFVVSVPNKITKPATIPNKDDEVITMSTHKNENSATSCNNQRKKSMSTDQAISKLKQKLDKQGVNDELHPIAKGRAQFMIGYSKGRTRGLMTLYDTGCGGVLFREGVPQKELQGSVLKTKGPFIVNGVGDTSVTVNDEYLCAMELVDDTRQIMEGWTVNKITATLPMVSLGAAEAELKSSNKDNSELQDLRCPPQAGGDCDVLLGILYSSIFPEEVHSLENGLTIYKLRLTPHDKRYSAVIGGPHESFQFMTQEFGGLSIVFANLTQQLQTYQDFGPPKIQNCPMTEEEWIFAKKHSYFGIEDFEEIIDEFEDLQEESHRVVVSPSGKVPGVYHHQKENSDTRNSDRRNSDTRNSNRKN